MGGDASRIQPEGKLAAAWQRRRAVEIHENHECVIHEFAMLFGRPLATIRHVLADSLLVHHRNLRYTTTGDTT
jgi:hypothetical protein